jgi:hypothetical protein
MEPILDHSHVIVVPLEPISGRLSKSHAANTHRTCTCIQHFHSNIQTIVSQVVVRNFLKGTCFGFVLSTQTRSRFTVNKGVPVMVL